MVRGVSSTHHSGGTRWRRVFTVFIDNIHQKSSEEELKELFSEFGKVVGTYIAKKERRNTKFLFGFVRFATEEEALRAIRGTNGMRLNGINLFVKMARFTREWYGHSHEHGDKSNRRIVGRKDPSRTWRIVRRRDERSVRDDGRPIARAVDAQFKRSQQWDLRASNDKAQEKQQLRIIKGETNKEALEWLQRSLIADANEPKDVKVIEEMLMREWLSICKVRDLGRFKFIITFVTKEDMEAAFDDGLELLLNHFTDVRKWAIFEKCETRRVWLEVHDLPPHAWSKENIEKIGGVWGDVVYVDRNSQLLESMESAKVLIDTTCLFFIEERCYFILEDGGTDIFIKEIGNSALCPSPVLAPKFSVSSDLSISSGDQAQDLPEVSAKGGDGLEEVEEVPLCPLGHSTSGPTENFEFVGDEEPSDVGGDEHWKSVKAAGPEAHSEQQNSATNEEVVRHLVLKDNESSSSQTRVADVTYNELEEDEIISHWAFRNRYVPLSNLQAHVCSSPLNFVGLEDNLEVPSYCNLDPLVPPGFSTPNGNHVPMGDVAKDGMSFHNPVDVQVQTFEEATGNGSTKSTVGNRRKNRQKKTISFTGDVCSDEESLDEEDEVMKTWEIGKIVGLICQNENEAISSIRTIRRSKRLEKKRRARGA